MTRVDVAIAIVVSWGALRLLAGRATIATREFGLFFLVGATVSTAFALAVERLVLAGSNHERVTHVYAGPIEELAKALPLLVVLGLFSARRRLTLADWILVGFAGAAGFTTVQWLLELTVPPAQRAVGAAAPWHTWLLGSRHVVGEWGGSFWFAGAASTAFVGLVVGLGVRFGRSRIPGAVAAVAALAVVSVDAGLVRFEGGPLSSGGLEYPTSPGGFLSALHTILLHGRLELWVLVAGIVAAGWIEGRWTSFSLPEPARVLLPDEPTAPLVVAEWIVALRRGLAGWPAFTRTNAYFRERRTYTLVLAQLQREPESRALLIETLAARDRLVAARAALEQPSSLELPSRAAVARWARVHALQLVAALGVVVVLLVRPHAAGAGIAEDGALAIVLALAALFAGAARLRDAHVQRRAGIDSDAKRLAAVSAIALAGFALLVSTMSVWTLIPDLDQETIALDPIEQWASLGGYPHYGGNPHVLFALLAFVAASATVRLQRAPRDEVVTAPAAVA